MNSSVTQQYTKLKYSKTAIILNLLFIERELRLHRNHYSHVLRFGPHKVTPQATKDIEEAYKDNSETDDELTDRFYDVSTEGVNL